MCIGGGKKAIKMMYNSLERKVVVLWLGGKFIVIVKTCILIGEFFLLWGLTNYMSVSGVLERLESISHSAFPLAKRAF